MKKQVLVTVRTQYYSEGETETSDFFAEGLLYLKNEKYYLIFDTVYDEDVVVKTTLIMHSPNNVTLKNSGYTNYSIELEESVPYNSLVSFQGLTVDLEFQPEKVQCKISPDGHGNSHMKYLIKGNGVVISENTVDIKITPNTK